MPAELVEFFVKFYAKPGDVYLDPFMGQGVQMQVAKILGLQYYGYDLSTEFFGYIDSVRSKIDDGKTVLNITHGDSRFPSNIPDGIGDFSFHSPPYWDIENYGDEPGQLGNGSYEEFLVGMRDVARAWLPKFKPGAFHVVNVNDFRKDGRFYPYHADTIRVYKEAGWELFDTWIIAGLLISASASIFARGKIERRIAPKVHEYALVFRRRS
jgi:DNA modification methylase